MASGENRLIRRRLAGAWLSTVISISLVLLLVGVAGLLVANARSVSDYFKENMQVSVLMKQEVGDDEAMEYVSDHGIHWEPTFLNTFLLLEYLANRP